MSDDQTKTCDECGSLYHASTSRMDALCPECAHRLYGYDNCDHVFVKGRCSKCFWDGAISDFCRRSDEVVSGTTRALHLTHKVQISRFVDDSFPGWVECLLRDASGREWQFIDKIPIFTELPLSERDAYPQEGKIACEILEEWRDDEGRQRCLVDTLNPDGIEAIHGETHFEVFRDQLQPLPFPQPAGQTL